MSEARESWKKYVLHRLGEFGVSPSISQLDPDFWFFVASQIAFQFIPRFEDKRGRPKIWNDERSSLLIAAVKQLHPKSEKEACKLLAKRGDFKGNEHTIYRRLHFAKARARKTRYSDLAKLLAGCPIPEPDAAVTAPAHTPVLDGLGTLGGAAWK